MKERNINIVLKKLADNSVVWKRSTIFFQLYLKDHVTKTSIDYSLVNGDKIITGTLLFF